MNKNREIIKALGERILVLDGAMGTQIQQFGFDEADFRGELLAQHPLQMKGNNDVLNLTQPGAIAEIHGRYVKAGADIISTNTFNSQRISQKDYGCEGLVGELAREGARIARSVADGCADRKVWVAGSMGPTNKTLSLASDINEPSKRDVGFDEMLSAYREQAAALAEGGVDLFLLETCFDALNTKAALAAIAEINEALAEEQRIPVMVSATINDRSGRVLTGQTLEAFFVSISHYPILSFGINCSFGIQALIPFVKMLSEVIPAFVSVHPNAGMPNEMGEYDEKPDFTAGHLRALAEGGHVNIVGGCCGTTPEHIKKIAEAVKGLPPRRVKQPENGPRLTVSGLEPLVVDKETSNFINIGERTNVAGSRKFARLIAAHDYEEASSVARKQIEGGASIIDINMDDAMLDSSEEMKNFVRFISNDPAIARVPLMIDSSDWGTILQGLKNAQGKCIVNSISLKGGEEDFINKAQQIKRLGAAVVVMAFDEEGQATTYERKIEICERAYRLLVEKAGLAPQDIIFDVNVLSVGTGIKEHENYGIDFIRAVGWIKENLPEAKTSGGISNLSFAFRGNNEVREAMHSVFLYHAIAAGLDMAIMNPSMIQVYDEIEPTLLRCCEDVILNRNEEATEALIERAKASLQLPPDGGRENNRPKGIKGLNCPKGPKTIQDRFALALTKGISDNLEDDIKLALAELGSPVAVIEGPLMNGMERVGKLFGEGKMFLPQVVKAAKVMKQAVEILSPHMQSSQKSGGAGEGVILMATAKGDVHDIGKNIVDIVLGCNNFEVIDLGVMVDNETILETAKREKPLMVGISGLITPSLGEMEKLCRLFQENRMTMPIFVGGATTSEVHTAVKLAPLYDGGVFYGGDASATAVLAKRYACFPAKTLSDNIKKQKHIREIYEARKVEIDSYKTANDNAPKYSMEGLKTKEQLDCAEISGLTISDVEPFINWRMLLSFWGIKHEDEDVLNDARNILNEAKADGSLSLKTVLKFYNAHREGNDIVLENGTRLPMLRCQHGKYESLADFLPADKEAAIGLFCITADDSRKEQITDQYQLLMRHALRARIVEAAAQLSAPQPPKGGATAFAETKTPPSGGRGACRPAFGYACCPDHSLKRIVVDELDAENKLGIQLTHNYSINPSTTICGLLIIHPEAHYFAVGKIDEEQLQDYIRRRGITEEEGRQMLSENLN